MLQGIEVRKLFKIIQNIQFLFTLHIRHGFQSSFQFMYCIDARFNQNQIYFKKIIEQKKQSRTAAIIQEIRDVLKENNKQHTFENNIAITNIQHSEKIVEHQEEIEILCQKFSGKLVIYTVFRISQITSYKESDSIELQSSYDNSQIQMKMENSQTQLKQERDRFQDDERLDEQKISEEQTSQNLICSRKQSYKWQLEY
ncbi:hypothetical protein pb186bvf_014307 [Paramecium bursaria]